MICCYTILGYTTLDELSLMFILAVDACAIPRWSQLPFLTTIIKHGEPLSIIIINQCQLISTVSNFKPLYNHHY